MVRGQMYYHPHANEVTIEDSSPNDWCSKIKKHWVVPITLGGKANDTIPSENHYKFGDRGLTWGLPLGINPHKTSL